MMASKRLVILGATGHTGKPLLQQALSLGHTVTAVVRDDPGKVSTTHPNLNVVTGDVFRAESLEPILRDHDAVLSVLGFPKQENPMSDFETSISAILAAMRPAGVRRLVTISAWYTDPVSRVGQYMFDNMWSKIPGLVNTLDNEGEMEKVLVGATSDIDFTSVRVPTLTWDPVTSKDILVQDAHWVDGGSGFIPREDVARFMLSTLDDPTKWNGRSVAIAIKYTDEEMGTAAVRFKEHMAMYTK
jgi:hypothetical protein